MIERGQKTIERVYFDKYFGTKREKEICASLVTIILQPFQAMQKILDKLSHFAFSF